MPPYEAFDDADPRYHQQRYASLMADSHVAEADRLACYLLALAWSDPSEENYSKSPAKSDYKSIEAESNALKTSAQPPTTVGGKPKAYGKADLNSRSFTKIAALPKPPLDADEKAMKSYNDAQANRQALMRQLDINLDCTAAALLDDVWYFAANSVKIQKEHVAQVSPALGGRKVVVVDYADPNLHAEMKLLRHFKENALLKDGITFGVSKPCCPLCRKHLDKYKVVYTSFHNREPPPDRYTDPF